MTSYSGTMQSSGGGLGKILIVVIALLVVGCAFAAMMALPATLATGSASSAQASLSVIAADVPTDVAGQIPGPLGGLDGFPDEALEHLLRPAHHAWAAHTTTDCAIQIIRNLPHNQVYASLGSEKQTQPSLAFVWYLDKAFRDLTKMGALGACSGLSSQLEQEFGPANYVDDLSAYRLVVSVGYDVNRGFFVFSAYPVTSDPVMFDWQMCDWGYKWRIFPKFRLMPCAGGF